MKTRRKPVVGERLFVLGVGNGYRKEHRELKPMIVTRVGTKYFTVETEDGWKGTSEFRICDWGQRTNCSANMKLYESNQDWLDETESVALQTEIRAYFGIFGREPKLPLEELRKIHQIIRQANRE